MPPLPTERLYLNDTYAFTSSSTIVDIVFLEEEEAENDGQEAPSPSSRRVAIITAATVFHPQGGGQPSDVGRIISSSSSSSSCSSSSSPSPSSASTIFHVESVRDNGEGILYHHGRFDDDATGTFEVGEAVTLEVDEARRRLHARLHSAGHALDVCVLQMGLAEHLKPTKGFHFLEGPFVEYKGKLPSDGVGTAEEIVDALNLKMQALIEEDIGTTVDVVSKPEAAKLLSSEADVSHFTEHAQIRLVSVGGNLCPCGGTHVQSTKELGPIEVTKIKTKKNVTKISYRLGKKEETVAASASD
jgi:Ser-tRNA(Ala) deacylase AlaX